ncbi:membrane lipoprotein lipid attachment site-containing protein [Patescibacteria group bacterium]|nr:membrane lipoprotein lipid attachment site-containing protein [Patescibacteria group bacterium]
MKKILFLFIIVVFLTACGVEKAAPKVERPEQEDLSLTKTFYQQELGYSINYPGEWLRDDDKKNFTLGFSNGKVAIKIQNLESEEGLTKILEDFKEGFPKMETLEISDPQTYMHGDLEGVMFDAEYSIAKGEKFKQHQIIVPHPAGRVFFAWSYTAIADQYDKYLPTALEMLGSWDILQ